jgi:hypothetical protein
LLNALSRDEDDKLNEFGLSVIKQVEEQEKAIKHWRAISRWLFVIAYIIGTSLLLVSEYDKAG